MRYIHKMEYYSAFMKKEILTRATAWMILEAVKLSEISRSQRRQIQHDSTLYELPRVVGFIETESRMVVPGAGGGERELVFHGYRVSVLQVESILEMDGGGVCTAMGMYLTLLNT